MLSAKWRAQNEIVRRVIHLFKYPNYKVQIRMTRKTEMLIKHLIAAVIEKPA